VARVITLARTLDLDDPSTEIGESHRRERAGEHSSEIRDQNPGERQCLR
jgi:hypothetical protein